MARPAKVERTGTVRPQSPGSLLESIYTNLRPAPEVSDWAYDTILAEDGPLHNLDHAHLIDTNLCFLWASGAFNKQGRTVIGQAEQVMFRALVEHELYHIGQAKDEFGAPKFTKEGLPKLALRGHDVE